MADGKSRKKSGSRSKRKKSRKKGLEPLVTTRPIPFGGFYYDDATLMARRVHVSIVANPPDGDPVTIEDEVDVEGDGRAEWHPGDVEGVIRVWFAAVNAAGIMIAAAAAFESWPQRGGYIESARGWTYIPIGAFNAVSEIDCDVVEPLVIREHVLGARALRETGIIKGIPFGRFYYDDQTGGASLVDMTVVERDGGTYTEPRVRVVNRHAELPNPGRFTDVIAVSFQPWISRGIPLGEAADSGPRPVIEEAGGMTRSPIVENVFVSILP